MGAAKLPFFQFYPADWLGDPLLRACSLAARGLWADFICLMWESPRRGYLMTKEQRAYTNEQLARMTGCPVDVLPSLVDELYQTGVCSMRKDGVIFSRRMSRDEDKRAKERLRKSEERSAARQSKKAEEEAKSLLNQQKCPDSVRPVSGECPGDITEFILQKTEDRENTHTEAAGAPGEARCVSPPPPDFDASEIAKRIWQRHPAHRRGTLQATERAFAQRLMGAVAPAAVAADVDRRHAGWCVSRQWREGVITGLTKWLTSDDPGCCLTEPPPPPGEGEPGPVEALTFGAKREQRMVKRFLERVALDVG